MIINHERNGDWMQTFSGVQFYPLDPHVGDVRIEDIAHALSNRLEHEADDIFQNRKG
jgi:hypothetical protein